MADPADRVIEPVKKQLLKIFNSPFYYLLLFISFFLSLLLIHLFVEAIGPAGINPSEGTFFYYFIHLMVSAFGQSFVDHLFSQGPFGLAFIIACLPLLIFLMINSTSQLNLWLNLSTKEIDLNHIGLMALVYILTCIISFSILFLFFSIISIFTNLILGNMFFIELIFGFLVFLSFWSYWFLIFTLLKNKRWSIVLSFIIILLFIFTAICEFMIINNNLIFFSEILNSIVQWISPINYFSKFLTAIFYDQSLLAIGHLFLLIILIVIINLTSLFLLKSKMSKGG